MTRRPPRSTRTDTLFPYPTLFRACAERGDFACALTHWHALAQSAPNPPRWLPEAYALALWGLGRHEQAIAWYDTAVLGTPHLGNGRVLPGRFFNASLYRSEEQTSELQSLMRISYAVFCLKKKKKN